MLEAAIFFQKFPNVNGQFLKTIFQETYLEICIFCSAVQCIVSKKQPVGSAHEVLAESLETTFDEAYLQLICIVSSNPQPSPATPFPPSESFISHPPQTEQLPKFLSSRHMRNSLSVYLFLNSEPQPGKSKESNNQGLKVNRDIKCYILFFPSKNNKNRQALHEIIRASSLSIFFVESSVKPTSPTMVVKNFKFIENTIPGICTWKSKY